MYLADGLGFPEAPIVVNYISVEENLPDPVAAADKAMWNYKKYVDDLSHRLPGSFSRLDRFLNRGNCECFAEYREVRTPKHVWNSFQKAGKEEKVAGKPDRACGCIETGGNCTCQVEKDCKCTRCPNDCKTHSLNESVQIYTIDPDENDWSKFLKVKKFETTKPEDFEKLKKFLFDREFDPQDDSNEVETQTSDDDPIPTKRCRLITVNHLSPKVASLLGGKFNISADFFNRHLPGTEAISGKLLSRLPSSVQIDFDELYESRLEFDDLWPGDYDAIKLGHNLIKQSINNHFLFDVGWDYFPVTKTEWLSSIHNVKMKSGFECLQRDEGQQSKNVFQFNLFHRISIFSQPVGHPRTGQSTTLIFGDCN